MHSFLRISILLLSILIGIQVFAENFEDKTINNITYTYISGKNNIKAHAKVISGKNASGNITLPNEVEFHKKEWNKDKGIYDDVYATVPVCVIGSRSFSKNVNIQSVTANYIDSIESSAFEGCTSLVQVKAGNTLKKIKKSAFSGCTALKSINIPYPGLISIEASAFADCISLFSNSTLRIPKTVTFVGYSAFQDCGVKEVAWETQIAIPQNAFRECINLASISLGNTSGIGALAFYDCKSLNSIGTIPSSCTSIGNFAFKSCTSLSSFTLTNGITDIGEYAFSGTAITNLHFPEGCNNLTIHAYAFHECLALKEISFLKSKNIIIENKAFWELKQLETILFSEGIVKIGANNFSDCPLLKDFELPNTIEQIGDYDIHKNGYKEILYGCFNNCPLLTKIDLPANVADKTIELYYSFCECETLNKASKAPNQNYIYDKCFQRCPMLGAVTTRKPSQSNVTSRASRSNAKSIIRNGSFDDCENLEHFDCEFTLEEGGGFMWCNKLKFDTYHIPYNEIVPTRAAPSCFVKHVTMPMSVRQLNRAAIINAGTISIPDSLRVIQTWALGVDEMTEIVLPDSLHSVQERCITAVKLQKLTLKSKTPPVFYKENGVKYTLEEIENASSYSKPYIIYNADKIPLYVPRGTAKAYRNAPGWKDFKEIIEYGENSAVDDISITAPTVSVEGGRIVVSGSVPVMIFNLSGILLYNGNSDNIPALPKGLYIVKAAATTTKISL